MDHDKNLVEHLGSSSEIAISEYYNNFDILLLFWCKRMNERFKGLLDVRDCMVLVLPIVV